MGYHKRKIKKGKLGDVSKITEEYEEFLDGTEQQNPILILCELCDLIGAIEAYTEMHHKISLKDLVKMKECTKGAFKDGSRVPSV
jgi:hypothetical protein